MARYLQWKHIYWIKLHGHFKSAKFHDRTGFVWRLVPQNPVVLIIVSLKLPFWWVYGIPYAPFSDTLVIIVILIIIIMIIIIIVIRIDPDVCPEPMFFSGKTTRVFNRPPRSRGRVLDVNFWFSRILGFLAESGPFAPLAFGIRKNITITRPFYVLFYVLFEGMADDIYPSVMM